MNSPTTSPGHTRPRSSGRSEPPATRQLGYRLHREWARLRHHPTALLQASGWRVVDVPIDDLDQVLTAIGYEVPSTPAVDAALRRMVLAAGRDELAARVVLQRLLPGLLATVRRRSGRTDRSIDPFAELLGAAWIAITTFTPSRQPACLAAALISDAEHRAFRAPTRRRSSTEVPTDLAIEPMSAGAAPTVADEIRDLFAYALAAGIGRDDIGLLLRLFDADSPDDVARALRVTPRTVRNRRARITDQLRELALAA